MSFSAEVRTISVPTKVELSKSRLDTAGDGQVRVAPSDTQDRVTISTSNTCTRKWSCIMGPLSACLRWISVHKSAMSDYPCVQRHALKYSAL